MTDASLVALAHAHVLHLATFDARLTAICEWSGAVEVVPPATD